MTPSADEAASEDVWKWMTRWVQQAHARCITDNRRPYGPPKRPKAGSHTVARGDSLSAIAGEAWDDVLLWPILYDANAKTIGRDWNRIQPGQRLVIPDIGRYTPAQLDAARQRGRNW